MSSKLNDLDLLIYFDYPKTLSVESHSLPFFPHSIMSSLSMPVINNCTITPELFQKNAGLVKALVKCLDWHELRNPFVHPKDVEELIELYADAIDWDHVSFGAPLSENFIRKHANRVDWEGISQNQAISDEFAFEFKDRIDQDKLARNYVRKSKLNYNNFYVEVAEGSSNLLYPHVLIKYLDWHEMGNSIDLQPNEIENLICKYADQVDWDHVSFGAHLSEGFIRKHAHEVDWEGVSQNQAISNEFVAEFKDRIDQDALARNWKHKALMATQKKD